ncbi:DUF4870 domain-containing protein [Chitinolyticbacter albus]|uniref:DUF4870 domain-containing protein n=1 Tax=Chitinolyticbacter albus TaxID=2961951 RepID=UPI00210DD86E|nr:DUF4870 domain-containing protein [Chitinolyticbacter albus]
MSEVQPVPPSQPSNDSTTFAVLAWLGLLLPFIGFVAPLLVLLTQKEDDLAQSHSKEALNWIITVLLVVIPAWILVSILVFIPVLGWILVVVIQLALLALAIVSLVFLILGAVNASKGLHYRLPFNIRLIK